MRKTFSSTHVDAGDALRNLAELAKHDDGARTFALSGVTDRCITNLYAESPSQLQKLAGALQTLADEWEADRS